jgi:hypothetical protein
MGGGECIMSSFMICSLHETLIECSKSRRMVWAENVVRISDAKLV